MYVHVSPSESSPNLIDFGNEKGSHDDGPSTDFDVEVCNDDGESVSMLKDIFIGKQPAEIEHAVRMSHGSISLAALPAQQLLADSEGTVLFGMNEITSQIPAKYDTTYS